MPFEFGVIMNLMSVIKKEKMSIRDPDELHRAHTSGPTRNV